MAGRGHRQKDQRMFTMNKVPGFAAQMRRDPTRSGRHVDVNSGERSADGCLRSRDSSPKMPRPRSEEIPLEDMCIARKSSLVSNGSALPLAYPERRDSSVSSSSGNGEMPTPSYMRKRSEETSFTSPQSKEVRTRRKGQVETV